MTMPNASRLHLLLALLIFALVSVACGARVDQTATFYDDQSWDAELVITIPQEMMVFGVTSAAIEREIANEIRNMEAAGVQVSYESRTDEGTLQYYVEAKGDNLISLQRIAFDGADIAFTTVDGQPQIAFAMFVPRDLAGSSITLIGKEILSSNGRITESGRVEWLNPTGRIEAVIVPKSRFDITALLGPLGAGAGLLAMVSAGFYFARRRRSRSPHSHLRLCNHCGGPLGPNARFCATCGNPIYPN